MKVYVITVLIVPILLVAIASMGCAAFTDSVYTIASFSNADYEIEITDCQVVEYNGFGYDLYWDSEEVSFNDTLVFPGWELKLKTTIHNKATSWVCRLNYTIYYWNKTTSKWETTDETGLLNKFRIQYDTKFYNTTTGEEIPGEPHLLPCQSVHKIEHLFFDGQNYEELRGKTFLIKIKVIATYPNSPENSEGGT